MENFTKVLRIGETRSPGTYCDMFVKVEYASGKLSITGVEGPMRNGDAKGSCGQIIMHDWEIVNYAPGWDASKVAKLRQVWEDWHLNDMQAGTPEQTEALKPFYTTRKYPENDYAHACEYLKERGLYEVPDPRQGKEGETYRYGMAWLRVEVPADVLEFLKGLPDTDKAPAWI